MNRINKILNVQHSMNVVENYKNNPRLVNLNSNLIIVSPHDQRLVRPRPQTLLTHNPKSVNSRSAVLPTKRYVPYRTINLKSRVENFVR
jgi:hypothetical protein